MKVPIRTNEQRRKGFATVRGACNGRTPRPGSEWYPPEGVRQGVVVFPGGNSVDLRVPIRTNEQRRKGFATVRGACNGRAMRCLGCTHHRLALRPQPSSCSSSSCPVPPTPTPPASDSSSSLRFRSHLRQPLHFQVQVQCQIQLPPPPEPHKFIAQISTSIRYSCGVLR